jgi:hypothetical protein
MGIESYDDFVIHLGYTSLVNVRALTKIFSYRNIQLYLYILSPNYRLKVSFITITSTFLLKEMWNMKYVKHYVKTKNYSNEIWFLN